ncbi:MAG: N-acetylmuramoyl-L-alanine amidase [Chloroflexi bacterium]|nr:MAG: N-acetylmuramoyl-L-alanine amidase [Chloroflexota bacterium]
MIFYLDNGHGRHQAGKRSLPFLYEDREVVFEEWRFNRNVVAGIIALNNASPAPLDIVHVSPQPEDLGQWLGGRVAVANSDMIRRQVPVGEALFISVHANSVGLRWDDPSGFEAWHCKGSSLSEYYAGVFANNLPGELGLRNRGVKASSDMYVLVNTHMPAVLLELGFYSNLAEVKRLYSHDFQQQAAGRIYATMRYLDEMAGKAPV